MHAKATVPTKRSNQYRLETKTAFSNDLCPMFYELGCCEHLGAVR